MTFLRAMSVVATLAVAAGRASYLKSSLLSSLSSLQSEEQHRVERGNRTGSTDANYVFLQKFPLYGNIFGMSVYHTEVLVCERRGFDANDQAYLDKSIEEMRKFAQIPDEWWKSRSAHCVQLGYGGAYCRKRCCSVDLHRMRFNELHAVIGNADLDKRETYVYGTGSFDGAAAYHHACDRKCWSNWSGLDYNPLFTNCNTFTSTILSCVYGLSQKKPRLGVSDMVTVDCHCVDHMGEKTSDTGVEL